MEMASVRPERRFNETHGGNGDKFHRKVWTSVVPDSEQQIYDTAGYGVSVELRWPVALLVVDTTTTFTGLRDRDVEENIRQFPDSCGKDAWRAVAAIELLLAACRRVGVLRVFTRGPMVEDMGAMGGWSRTKQSRIGGRLETFPTELHPREDELVLEKLRPSAFFGTSLAIRLLEGGIKGIILCGGTASGCVRASAVDAFSWGFDVVVAEDAVFDRASVPRAVNLFDIDQKYGNVWTVDEVVAWLQEHAAEACGEKGSRAERIMTEGLADA